MIYPCTSHQGNPAFFAFSHTPCLSPFFTFWSLLSLWFFHSFQEPPHCVSYCVSVSNKYFIVSINNAQSNLSKDSFAYYNTCYNLCVKFNFQILFFNYKKILSLFCRKINGPGLALGKLIYTSPTLLFLLNKLTYFTNNYQINFD